MSSISLLVVVAAARADRLATILECFHTQTLAGAKLLLVLNGPAREASFPSAPRVAALRSQGGTPARARNAGLEWAQLSGFDLVAFWDDDDAYLPGYLAEVAALLDGKPRRVIGQGVRRVAFDDEELLFLGKQRGFLGGTMAGWARELFPVPDISCDEDHAWCQQLEREGFELKASSGKHYIYNRRGSEHAWRGTKVQMLHCYGPALELGGARAFRPRASVDDIANELGLWAQSDLSEPGAGGLYLQT